MTPTTIITISFIVCFAIAGSIAILSSLPDEQEAEPILPPSDDKVTRRPEEKEDS